MLGGSRGPGKTLRTVGTTGRPARTRIVGTTGAGGVGTTVGTTISDTVGTAVGATSVGEAAPFAIGAGAPVQRAGIVTELARFARSVPWTVCLITAIAAALRFAELDDVSPNPFYDAAVRSMSLSWHNLFFGAFDPGGFLSVDKPPLDLWLQVASVKLFGWNPAALKLPEALGGTLTVPLLYDAVRRAVGRPAGLAAAIALAVLPASVLTSRSDTMDSVMMLLIVAALWLTIRAVSSGERRFAVLVGVALGLAFNVKLLEGLIALPALVVLYWLASPAPARRKVADTMLGAGALIVVGLSWVVAASLAPGHHPFPVGSTDGTVWNVIFVFNGFGRVTTALPHHAGGPGLLRLVEASPAYLDMLLGCVLIAALVLGGFAVVRAVALRRMARQRSPSLAGALAVALFVWITVAVALFDHVALLHVRYSEALAPALAAAIGCGAASLAGLLESDRSDARISVRLVVAALALICAYTFSLQPYSIGWAVVALTVATVGAVLVAKSQPTFPAAKWLTLFLIVASALLFPIHESLSLVRSKASDSMGLRTLAPPTEAALQAYLGPRTAGLRYELAIDEPLALAPLIIHDQRPIFPLTSFLGVPAVGLNELRAAVRAGAVRYAMLGTHTCKPSPDRSPACVPAARWIRQNGIDVSRAAGIGRERLYLLLPY